MVRAAFWVWFGPWLTQFLSAVALPLGIALIGAATSIAIAVTGDMSRRRDRLEDLRQRRIERDEQADKELFLRRAEALEGFFAATRKFAAEVDRIRSVTKNFSPEEMANVSRPNDFSLNEAISRLATRAREREVRDAAWRVINAGRYLPLFETPTVFGPVQTTLEKWHVGAISRDEAIAELDDLTHRTHLRAEALERRS